MAAGGCTQHGRSMKRRNAHLRRNRRSARHRKLSTLTASSDSEATTVLDFRHAEEERFGTRSEKTGAAAGRKAVSGGPRNPMAGLHLDDLATISNEIFRRLGALGRNDPPLATSG